MPDLDCPYRITILGTKPELRVYIHSSWVEHYQNPKQTAYTFVERALAYVPTEFFVGSGIPLRYSWKPFDSVQFAIGLLKYSTVRIGRRKRLARPKHFKLLEICTFSNQGAWPQESSKGWRYQRGQWHESLGLFMGTSLPILTIEPEYRFKTSTLQEYIKNPPGVEGIEDIVHRAMKVPRQESSEQGWKLSDCIYSFCGA